MNDEPTLQSRLDALLAAADTGPAGSAQAFSPFVGDGAARAGALAVELREVAQSDGLEAAISAAEQAATDEPAGLVKRALKVFVTHEPMAMDQLSLPVIEVLESEPVERQPPPPLPPPGGALPPGIPGLPPRGDDPDDAGIVEAAPPPEDQPETWDAQLEPSLTEPAAERALDWYREDPFANDHHGHWHIVYPRDGNGASIIQRRHGELFFYMHLQMLARYDTERVIAGLDRTTPFPPPGANGGPDYAAAIPEGYGSRGYTQRRPGRSFSENPPEMERVVSWHRALMAGIEAGGLDFGNGIDLGPLSESQLGAATEAAALNTGEGVIDLGTVFSAYGNLHGQGHGISGDLGEGDEDWGGVMHWTETAICDPFFYRWHKHVDDVNARFQEASDETNDPSAFAPADVSFGSGRTMVFCLSSAIAGAADPGFDFDAFARNELGEDLDGADQLLTTELVTRFVRSRVTAGLPGTQRVTYWTTHLVHEPFTCFLRLENAADEERGVTVRVFLAHGDLAEDRRAWIELDKFEAALAPGVNVLARPDARSSVIKRRGVTAPGVEPLDADAADQWCECGWPYSLLIPSGASDAAGTPFTAMVAVTDLNQDREPDHTATCGSKSYCGALDNYPDKRRMGYPFDRPFAGQSIAEAIAAAPSMAAAEVTIRCENDRPPE